MAAGPSLAGFDLRNSSALQNLTELAVEEEWGDLLVGPYNQSESADWQREYVHQYQIRHKDDPDVKYAVVIFYLIMVRSLSPQNLAQLLRFETLRVLRVLASL